ncbi:DegT/DnrJ/EryC1/StrS family aminotransferase [Tropicimonas isoalkanivorans]|uniref:dTDP-4-amino-4,6-dideoxygalactose transaminase n=1 Tax=Tropicimonas isoalkanivorans TaxID=441112 RepID=A0A1I1LSM5_9RHOB|nr:DegT/DnrJ/EryC1/StrS family aminotransferase [Tropicimonas isoalkanivorans]SFC73948.1 dTDP-4-amino-4,6-dideoxygalactose transaminase [Tropicimonas isoalkanivorans]
MVPFLDLKRQYATIGAEIEDRVQEVLRSSAYVLGPQVEAFENAFATYCGADHAIAVSSGTSALHLALLAAGIEPGDEVITTPTTFVATVAAILYANATPVLVDIDPVTWCMDPARIEAAITPRTRAIMPVHFHGRLADMEAIQRVAQAHGLVVIEDAAQAHGASRGGKRAGTFGALGCFSFYPGKNLGAAGEGGAVTTNDPELARRLRQLRDWGQSERYVHQVKGYNYRMDGVQGAVLDVKLKHLDAWNAGRRRVANAYHEGLSSQLLRAHGPFGDDYVGHVYAIVPQDREAMRDALMKAGIGCNIHYPYPVHLQPAYAELGEGRGSFPVAEAYADRTLSLPIFPELRDDEIAQVIDVVNTEIEAAAGPLKEYAV